ncbi:MAG: hypothetical protein FJW36_12130 [Acidobacteria bacterium]|nr:hypothetical protein [Acidobacteriota bacterium]
MKVLLDENLPHRLRNALEGHEVFTVRYQGWSGLKNGGLLSVAEAEGFAVFLTGDQTLSFEQNLGSRTIAVVVLTAIEWHMLRGSVGEIQEVIGAAQPGSLRVVEVGKFSR